MNEEGPRQQPYSGAALGHGDVSGYDERGRALISPAAPLAGKNQEDRVTREKIAAAVITTIAALFLASWALQLYTVPDPWKLYVIAVRKYMAAGTRGDSTTLARNSAAAQPMAWVLEAARRRPAVVAAWARDLQGGAGERRGDTVVVALWANNVEGCSHLNSVSALLLNHSSTPRVLAISSPCIDRRSSLSPPW